MSATATDYRTQFDKDQIAAWDLKGRDVTLTIARWKQEKVGGFDGKKKSSKIYIWFREKQKNGDPIKPFICNITNAATIAGMHGKVVEHWIGKRITLYPTTTSFGRQTVDCIRIRPEIPGAGAAPQPEGGPVPLVDPTAIALARARAETGEGPPVEEPPADDNQEGEVDDGNA